MDAVEFIFSIIALSFSAPGRSSPLPPPIMAAQPALAFTLRTFPTVEVCCLTLSDSAMTVRYSSLGFSCSASASGMRLPSATVTSLLSTVSDGSDACMRMRSEAVGVLAKGFAMASNRWPLRPTKRQRFHLAALPPA